MQALVVIDKLTKSFKGMDKPALHRLSAKIVPGKMTGLVGPDGAGKTTLIRHIVGLMHPDSGSIHVGGYDTTTQAQSIHEMIGYMPQKFGLYEDLSVMENLRLYADLRHVAPVTWAKQCKSLLDFTGLHTFQKRLAGKLSGGMKQKLGLACALLGEPKLLLLDEPSVGVDPLSRRELWKMVQGLLKKSMAVVWSTAYLEEAEQCDTVMLLHEGELLHNGAPTDLLQHVKGRTWHLQGVTPARKRPVLLELLQQDSILDGVIRGNALRVVIAKNIKKPPPSTEGTWHAVAPCFEDAFIDLLGARLTGYSALAAQIEAKDSNDTVVIDAQALTKQFGDFTAVSKNSFQIKRGEVFGLLGPNGAGKSTTFKMLCGLLQPTHGEASVMGLNLRYSASEARAKIGYMAQKFSLYGDLTIKQNLTFFAGLYGLSSVKKDEHIAMMIDVFAFTPYIKMKAHDLPLGYKQRLALACALMHEPDVLFLDEPTSGVDPITRREFWGHINALVEKGVTIMVTTHFMDEAEYCDRVALIFHGENIATGSPDALKEMACKLVGKTELSMEEAFIALIEQQNSVVTNDNDNGMSSKDDIVVTPKKGRAVSSKKVKS